MTTTQTNQPQQPVPPQVDPKRGGKPKSELQVRYETFKDWLNRPNVIAQLTAALPAHLDIDRVRTILLNTLQRNSDLLLCRFNSVSACILQICELGLEPLPALGHVYLVPFNDKRSNQKLCQLIIGYKGFIELARRSGVVSNVRAEVVRKGDYFRYRLGLDPVLEHVPADVIEFDEVARKAHVMKAGSGELVAAYCVITLKDGSKEFRVVTSEYINRIKKVSRGSDSPLSPWRNWEDQMWMKTAIRQTIKFVPLSPEDRLVKGMDVDESTFADIGRPPVVETTGTAVPDASNGATDVSDFSNSDAGLDSNSSTEQSGMDSFVSNQPPPPPPAQTAAPEAATASASNVPTQQSDSSSTSPSAETTAKPDEKPPARRRRSAPTAP